MNKRLFASSYVGNLLSGLMHPLMNFFGNIGYALIIVLGGIMSIHDFSFAPVIVSFVIYYRMFNNQISQVATISSTLQTTLASSERIFEFLDEPEQSDESDKKLVLKDIKGEVEFKNVNFGYNPDKTILKNVSLYAKPGHKIAFVGSTGAGKTTIMNLITRFYDNYEGTITFDGIDVKNIEKESLRLALSVQVTTAF